MSPSYLAPYCEVERNGVVGVASLRMKADWTLRGHLHIDARKSETDGKLDLFDCEIQFIEPVSVHDEEVLKTTLSIGSPSDVVSLDGKPLVGLFLEGFTSTDIDDETISGMHFAAK